MNWKQTISIESILFNTKWKWSTCLVKILETIVAGIRFNGTWATFIWKLSKFILFHSISSMQCGQNKCGKDQIFQKTWAICVLPQEVHIGIRSSWEKINFYNWIMFLFIIILDKHLIVLLKAIKPFLVRKVVVEGL